MVPRVSIRPDRLTDLLGEAEIDALLVSELTGVRYLTGFTGSNGLAVIGQGTRVFLTDFRYVEQSAAEVDSSFDRRRVVQDLLDGIAEALPAGALRLGFDDATVSVRQHARLRELLDAHDGEVELVPSAGLVERLRVVKEPAEIEAIAAATALADAALTQILAEGLVGRTEREVAIALEQAMRSRGAQRPSFDSIVAGGAHGALPHAHPRDVPIKRGELVVIDWGAQLDGYCSDCTRTVAAGPLSDPEAAAVYGIVLAAQLAALDAVRAGISGKDADSVARDAITAAGHGEHFGHGLGHGVGLEVHEGPRLSQRSTDDLQAGSIATVEPGIYLPGRFGVRIEDLVVVRDDGCEILTSLPKHLTVVD
ncbi:MAG: M24 family metallopeptidase [Solirubrobacteraceae bacterium]